MLRPLRYAARLLTGVALAFATAGVLAPLARAQHFGPHAEPRFERHLEPHRGFEPHLHFDDRFHHDHFYPAVGFAIAALPLGYYTVHHFDGDYYFHSGVWYRHVGASYVVVQPPIGALVPLLPPDYTTIWVGAVPYYYANGIYYDAAPGGYAVVAPPASASVTPPGEQAANAPGPAGNWYYCESAKSYYPYVSQCAEGWRTMPANPPPS